MSHRELSIGEKGTAIGFPNGLVRESAEMDAIPLLNYRQSPSRVADVARAGRIGGSSAERGGEPPVNLCGSKTADRQGRISFARRRLNLSATPHLGMFISAMDLDLTVSCNLRCTYCFKEKWTEHMEEEVAFDAIVWLLYASSPVKQLTVNFMGGEPLMRFPLIKAIVPFAKRRAWQVGKSIHFGMTTNGTLVTNEVVDFWKKWGMGFHTSIDGTPEVQDRNRPMADGRASSPLVERAVPRILGYRPKTTARSTVTEDTAGSLVRSYRYFRSLGYVNIAFVPAAPSQWSRDSLALYESQYSQIGDIVIDEFRNNHVIIVKGIDDAIKGILRNQRPAHFCGAARGLVLIDVHGAAIVAMAKALTPHAFVQLIVYFAEPRTQWACVLSALHLLRRTLRRPRDLEIRVIGPFGATSERDMESLFGPERVKGFETTAVRN